MDASPPDRVGLLIVRAWLESSDQRLVARITKTSDVVSEPVTVTVVGTTNDVHAAVENWLRALLAGETAR
jgi:hypothetical protein